MMAAKRSGPGLPEQASLIQKVMGCWLDILPGLKAGEDVKGKSSSIVAISRKVTAMRARRGAEMPAGPPL